MSGRIPNRNRSRRWHYPTFDWALILDDGQSSDPFPHAGGGPALVLVGADDAGDPVAMIRPVLAA